MRRTGPVVLSLLVSAATVWGCSSGAPSREPAPTAPPAAAAAPAADAPPVATPAPAAEASTAPASEPAPATDRAPAAVAPADAKAYAYFYRKKTILGAALNTSVHVDGIEVADLDPGTYVKVPLEPGKHAFYSDEEDDTLKLEIEAGKEYYFRIMLKAGMWKGHGVLNRVDPSEGAPEFEEWKLKLAEDIRKPEMVVKDPRKP